MTADYLDTCPRCRDAPVFRAGLYGLLTPPLCRDCADTPDDVPDISVECGHCARAFPTAAERDEHLGVMHGLTGDEPLNP